MDIQKCCNPFRIKNHHHDTSSNISPVSVEFLEENFEFISRKVDSNMFICESCMLKIKSAAANYNFCCNPLEKFPHKTRNFSVITEKIKQQYFLYTNKLPINGQLCTSCRLQITRNLKQHEEMQTKCVNPFRLPGHSIGRKGVNTTGEMRRLNPTYAHLLIAGRKICCSCLNKLERKRKSFQDDNNISSRKKPHFEYDDESSLGSSTVFDSNFEDRETEIEEGCMNPFQIAWHNIGSESTSVTSEIRINLPSDCHGSFRIDSKICSDCRTVLETKRKRAPDDIEGGPQKRHCVEFDNDTNLQLSLFTHGYGENRRKEFQYDTESECSMESNSDDYENLSSEDKDDSDIDMCDYADLRAVDELNRSFAPLNISPLISSNNVDKKYHRFKDEVKKRLDIFSAKPNNYSPKTCNKCEYILDAAKIKFCESTTQQKYSILTTVSKGISKNKLKNIFGCSKKLVKKTVELRKRYGPFSHPTLISTTKTSISSNLKQKVIDFYKNPNNSRTLPGTRENIQIKTKDGKKDLVAKQRLLLTLRDLYKEFVQTHCDTNEKISISTFYLLKPRECIWMGNSMHQKVCCCIIHENFNQLLACLSSNIDLNWILSNVPCDAQNEACMFGMCSECPKNLDTVFTQLKNSVNVTFYQWVSTDRVDMNQITETVREYKTRFRAYLPELLKHHFLVRKQNRFVENWKENAKNNPNEVLVKIDFAMNYSFVFQNEVQSAHWHRKQATIHPFYVEYYCQLEQKLKNKTYIGISDHLKHDTVCFYSFQTYFIEMLKRDLPHVNKIVYISDGSSAQYKNRKNIVNLLHHKTDFGIDASWEYFPTAHGKSECDAASGTVKRSIRMESLRRKPDQPQISTYKDMLGYCQTALQNDRRIFFFVSKDMIHQITVNQEERFKMSKTIKGTRDYHSFRVLSMVEIEARNYSSQTEGKILSFASPTSNTHLNLNDTVAVRFGMDFNVGIISEIDKEEILVQFYKKFKVGLNYTFSWPQHKPTHAFLPSDIICYGLELVPTSKGRRAFKLSDQDLSHILSNMNITI